MESMGRGYFAIGVEGCKRSVNLDTLWRSAHVFGAAYIFVISGRYQRQPWDATLAWRSIPLFEYEDFDQFSKTLPRDTTLVGVEIAEGAQDIYTATHPERAIYLLGAEDRGLSVRALAACRRVLRIPSKWSLNVAVAGSIIMYDRAMKAARGDRPGLVAVGT